MIKPERSLIRSGDNFGRCGVGARTVSAIRIVREGIASKQRCDAAADGNSQSIAGKCGGVDALPLRDGRNREYLGGPENLPEALILREIKCLTTSIVNSWKDNGATVGETEFIAGKRRETASAQIALVVKVISCVERRIADKFEKAAMDLIAAGLRNHVRESSGAVTRVSRHYSGAGLHFLDSVDVEVGKGSAAELGVGGVRSIDGEDGGGATLAIDGELLREIGRAVGVCHGAGGEEKKPAEVAFVEGQAGHFSGGETLAAAGLGRSQICSDDDAEFLAFGRKLKSGGDRGAVFDDHWIRCSPNLARDAYRESVVAHYHRGECELARRGSCGGILAVSVRREELDGGAVHGMACRVAQDAAPGRRW